MPTEKTQTKQQNKQTTKTKRHQKETTTKTPPERSLAVPFLGPLFRFIFCFFCSRVKRTFLGSSEACGYGDRINVLAQINVVVISCLLHGMAFAVWFCDLGSLIFGTVRQSQKMGTVKMIFFCFFRKLRIAVLKMGPLQVIFFWFFLRHG